MIVTIILQLPTTEEEESIMSKECFFSSISNHHRLAFSESDPFMVGGSFKGTYCSRH